MPEQEAVTPSADDSSAPPANIRRVFMSMKVRLIHSLGWSLYEIDECDMESLFAFIGFKNEQGEQADPDIRIIDGNISRRVQGAPSWL